MVTVYSKNQCVQCNATYRWLNEKGVDYTVINVEEDPKALAYIKELGYLQAPVVVTDTEHWSGFNPDKLSSLA